jgi:hypothetical protein
VDSDVAVIGGGNDLAETKEKGLPTIFKYQGTGKEVFVCGEIRDSPPPFSKNI